MTLGVVMLVHTALWRAEQLARHWVAGGCPVVIHVDTKISQHDYDAFRARFADLPQVRFSHRYRCEWGTWGLVAATQAASARILADFPDVHHVYLASGSCLPLRPVADLRAYLQAHPDTDFIESVTTHDVPWVMDGLDAERFTLRFPFSWKRQRRLFDWYVDFQRRWNMRRHIPDGLVPHMGSQWWCLTRRTLEAMMRDPRTRDYDRYFRRVWIPDESYYQSLVRLHTRRIESRSLTLSKFDFQGKPHIFYDDHLQLLRRSDCFVARKIWPHANRLFDAFLCDARPLSESGPPRPSQIDRLFSRAVQRRTRGRPGLYMHSRFPNARWENGLTAGPYSVFEGFSELFPDFGPWLARTASVQVHGHLFAPEGAEFAHGSEHYAGALSRSAVLRDYDPVAFLRNLIWNTRGERQCFMYGPRDTAQIADEITRDGNAQICVITGAWALPLFREGGDFAALRTRAARLQQIEAQHLKALRAHECRAHVHIWSLAEFVENPLEPLQSIIDEIALAGVHGPVEPPDMVDLGGFGAFLQKLRNEGMDPYLCGDFPAAVAEPPPPRRTLRKPYLVRPS